MTEISLVKPSAPETSQDISLPKIWSLHLRLLGFAVAAIFALFWRDLWAMLNTWWNVSTYNHCLLIIPIIFWLVQQRREELVKITPSVWAPGLLWGGLAASGWLLGEAAGVSFARQLGVIMMLQAAVFTLLGRNVSIAVIFPMFYGFFLVPFGDELVPFLQTITADMSMVFLAWANIPAYIDGVFISTPTGYFEVAEACSGVKFLVAMVAYGALVCNLCFKSWNRRILFMLASIIIPIVANGIRAFGTMYIAHHTSIEFATGFDHIFYGWIFFAVVLALVMALGWPFFDRRLDDNFVDSRNFQTTYKSRIKTIPMIGLFVAIVAAPWLWTSALAAQQSVVPDSIAAPEITGWEKVDYYPLYEWEPQFAGANHHLLQRYRNRETGALVDMVIAVYDRQTDGREIVGYGQGGHDPATRWSWRMDTQAPVNGSAFQIEAPGPVVREVMSFYRIGGIVTGSNTAVKLETVKIKLLGGDQQAVAVLISGEKREEIDLRQSLEKFRDDLGSIENFADDVAGRR